MTMLSMCLGCQDEKNKGARITIMVVYGVVLALALFLAIKDIGLVTHTATKVWIVLLAAVMPELFIMLHGVSTSSMGVGFFSGSPIESKMSEYFTPTKMMQASGRRMTADMSAPNMMAEMSTPSSGSDASSIF
jgi:hypothetical protein